MPWLIYLSDLKSPNLIPRNWLNMIKQFSSFSTSLPTTYLLTQHLFLWDKTRHTQFSLYIVYTGNKLLTTSDRMCLRKSIKLQCSEKKQTIIKNIFFFFSKL